MVLLLIINYQKTTIIRVYYIFMTNLQNSFNHLIKYILGAILIHWNDPLPALIKSKLCENYSNLKDQ